MKDITDNLCEAAQRLEAGDHLETSEMIDLLLDASTALGMCEPPETEAPQFTGYELGSDDVKACIYNEVYIQISDGSDSVMFNGHEIDLLIKALTNLRPMMGEQK